jgi:hypothetical protein
VSVIEARPLARRTFAGRRAADQDSNRPLLSVGTKKGTSRQALILIMQHRVCGVEVDGPEVEAAAVISTASGMRRSARFSVRNICQLPSGES